MHTRNPSHSDLSEKNGKKINIKMSNITHKKEKVKLSASDDSYGYDIDLEIQDIEGIGPITAKKLNEAGISSVMDIAVATAERLASDIKSSKDSAAAFILAAQKLLRERKVLGEEFATADLILEKRNSMLRCSTGSQKLDQLLKGGIETQAVTELFGEFGSGKTQICYALCVMATRAVSENGLDGGVIYIDTEGMFRPERLQQISTARGLDELQILKKIVLCRVYHSSNLELIIKDIGKYLAKFKAKLLVVDSIISLHRAEYPGRGTLADRQQRLNTIIHKLVRIAEMFNIAVVVTNQVQSSPDAYFGDPTKATGGNIIAHTSTYRIYLRKSGENRIAKMVDSPYHPYSDIRFTVNEKGIDDLEETPKSKNKK